MFVGESGKLPNYLGQIPGKPSLIVSVPGRTWPAVQTGIGCDGWCQTLVEITNGLPVIATLDGH